MANGSLPSLGIAGGVGSGKSSVAAILAQLGCLVADSDALAREAVRDPAVRDRIVSWWGSGVLDESGEIDRGEVARIVFSRPDQRRRLESLVHPWIEAHRRKLFEQAPPDARALRRRWPISSIRSPSRLKIRNGICSGMSRMVSAAGNAGVT